MKKLLLIPLTLGILLLASCEKDPAVVFPGTWKIESGGEITFNTNGTGYAVNVNSSYYLNSCSFLDTNYFTWTATQDGTTKRGELIMNFLPDSGQGNCTDYTTISYKIKSKTNIQLGTNAVLLDFSDDLTKK